MFEIWNWFTVGGSLYYLGSQQFWKKKLNWQIYAELWTICLKVAFLQTFVDRRRHISNLVIHPRWSFFAKILEAVNFFRKSSILDVWMGSKYAFRGLCTAWFTKGTSHCSCSKSLNNNQQLLGKVITNKLTVSSSTDTLLKNQIFGDVFEEEDHKYAALRKELLIAPIVEHLKITTLGKSQW